MRGLSKHCFQFYVGLYFSAARNHVIYQPVIDNGVLHTDCRTEQGRSQQAQILEVQNYGVLIGNFKSEQTAITCGDPQGSISGPLPVEIYMLPLAQIIENNNNINYITISPEDHSLIQPHGKHLKSLQLKNADQAKNLGKASDPNFEKHIKTATMSVPNQLMNISRIKGPCFYLQLTHLLTVSLQMYIKKQSVNIS